MYKIKVYLEVDDTVVDLSFQTENSEVIKTAIETLQQSFKTKFSEPSSDRYFIAGTDSREGVEFLFTMNDAGDESADHFKNALRDYETEDGFNFFDFVEEVTTHNIPEEFPYTNYIKR